MKNLLKTRILLGATLCFLTLSCVWGGDDFFDDFSDGDARDGSPINWRQLERAYAPNDYSLTEQGLEFSDGVAVAANNAGTEYLYGDVSVTAQIRRTGNKPGSPEWWIWNEGDYFALAVRSQDNPADDCYWAVVNWHGMLQLGTSSDWTKTFEEVDLNPLNVQEQDLVLRLDTIGDRIQVWCWAAGESMPEAPQLTMTDTRYTIGSIGLLGGNDPESNWLVRWVEVISHDPKPEPVLDFNGNGQVDIKDLTKLIESWGQEDSSVDIVPDGVVDVRDLEVLMSSWGQEVDDPTLNTCWKLDETEGNIAYDSAGQGDAEVNGEPQWLATDGRINGALQLDGISNFVDTPLVINPESATFSVFAWVCGGLPGQVILSQAGGMDWLLIDTELGALKTALTQPPVEIRGKITGGPALISTATITDGNWHRVGLVRDGSKRILYVDDAEVVRDVETLASCQGTLRIGAGSDLAAGSFWSGMIDDVRVYDRAVMP